MKAMEPSRDEPVANEVEIRPESPPALSSSAPVAAARPEDVLAAYLASHDVGCPRCAYNLRGVESGVCPECGEEISLAISRGSSIGLRDGDYRLFFIFGFGWPMLAGIMNATRTFQMARSIASGYGYRRSAWGSGRFDWDAVDTMTWFRLGWAMYLAVAGLVGLIVVLRMWSRDCTFDRRARLTASCIFVFGVYVAWHVVWFVIEQFG